MIKNIIFDFGGVIIDKDDGSESFFKRAFPKSFKSAYALFNSYKMDLRLGKLRSVNFTKILQTKFETVLKESQLMILWEIEYKKAALIKTSSLNLVKKLRKKYKVYLFTNTIDLHAKYNQQRGIYNNFDRVFKSFEEKLAKPDKKAYLNVLNKIKSKAEECVFVDDLEENVLAAEKVGMKGVVYKNIAQLQAEIRRFGLKI